MMLKRVEKETGLPEIKTVPDVSHLESFVPNLENSRNFRHALGRFGTGITVVTIDTPEGPMGFTANSFSSVSLDPPMVLWSLARSAKRFAAFVEAEYYAIHVLAADQLDLCKRFARTGADFHGLDMARSEEGVPLLENCLARFVCKQFAAYNGGDHVIIVGTVDEVSMRTGAQDMEPLLFSSGSYGRFDPMAT